MNIVQINNKVIARRQRRWAPLFLHLSGVGCV